MPNHFNVDLKLQETQAAEVGGEFATFLAHHPSTFGVIKKKFFREEAAVRVCRKVCRSEVTEAHYS